jgi:hypothetical protein
MLKALLFRAIPLAALALSTTSALAFAEDTVAISPSTDVAADGSSILTAANTQTAATAIDTEHWTNYGYTITAPSSMWPMLELLHQQKFDWELATAAQRPTPLVWANLPRGVYGQYSPKQNVVRLSLVLQNESVEIGTAFLAHELTHLNDDLNGRLGDMTGDLCYAAETRAFVNEANFWLMVVGPRGKATSDPIENQENMKMHAFVGNSEYADLVLRTTASYIKQCGY